MHNIISCKLCCMRGLCTKMIKHMPKRNNINLICKWFESKLVKKRTFSDYWLLRFSDILSYSTEHLSGWKTISQWWLFHLAAASRSCCNLLQSCYLQRWDEISNINIALHVVYLQRRGTKIEKGNRNKSERKRSIT
jgi:hypothetical protein